MVNFDNIGGRKSVLKFHVFIFLTCEESVRIRLICEELVRFFFRFEELVSNFHKCEEPVPIPQNDWMPKFNMSLSTPKANS